MNKYGDELKGQNKMKLYEKQNRRIQNQKNDSVVVF